MARRRTERGGAGNGTIRPLAQSTPAAVAATGNGDGVAARAYLKWLGRGAPHGDDQRDWFEAEADLRADGVAQERNV